MRSKFRQPRHAGEEVANADRRVCVRANAGGAGARILLTAVTDGDRLGAVRFRVFGCPHLIAAAESACERFEGNPVENLAEFSAAGLMAELDVPVEKTGLILLLEDAFRQLKRELQQAGEREN